MFRDPLVAPANKRADRRRSRVENVDSIFFDDFPKPIGLGPVRRAFVHNNGGAGGERAIDDVTMPGYPAHISRAPEDIVVANVEDVLGSRINVHEITTGGVQNSFWFSGGSACVKKVKRMLAIEWRRRAVGIDVLQFSVPPNVTAFLHVDVVSGAAKNDHPPD